MLPVLGKNFSPCRTAFSTNVIRQYPECAYYIQTFSKLMDLVCISMTAYNILFKLLELPRCRKRRIKNKYAVYVKKTELNISYLFFRHHPQLSFVQVFKHVCESCLSVYLLTVIYMVLDGEQ